MAHLLDLSNDRANIAYVGQRPWHGLGEQLKPDQTMDEWRVAAGLDWDVNRTPVFYEVRDDQGKTKKHMADQDVLYRSDTMKSLGIVSERYNEVQPKQIIDFYQSLTEEHGFKMETAGSLDGGKRIWCLARTGQEFILGKHDRVESYVLLATSYDKTMATRAQFTSVRVVCQNTLNFSLQNTKGGYVSIPHSATFDASRIKFDLGIVEDSFEDFEDEVTEMSKIKLSDSDTLKYLMAVLNDDKKDIKTPEELSARRQNILKGVFGMYKGDGKGSSYESANGTVWGAVNAVTEYVDHRVGRNPNNRMAAAWFGRGVNTKKVAYQQALKMVG